MTLKRSTKTSQIKKPLLKTLFTNKYVLYGFGLLLFFLVWEIISLIINEPILIFPGPIKTIKEAFNILSKGSSYKHIGASYLRLLIGYSISLIFAFIIANINATFPKIHTIIKPFITITKSVPTATLIFIFLLIVSRLLHLPVENAAIFIVIIISFPILYDAIVQGSIEIDSKYKDITALYGNSRLDNIIKVRIPLTYKYLLLGISSSFALSFKTVIMSEVLLGGTTSGIGTMIGYYQRSDTNMLPIFAYSLIAILMILLVDIISFIIKRRIKVVD